MRLAVYLATFALYLQAAPFCSAQDAQPQQDKADSGTPSPAPAPTPLATPAITGPIANLPPVIVDAGPVGKIAVNGILSGMGFWQDNHVPGDNPTQAALSNGQLWVQKTDGWFQFYIQAGAYNLPDLGASFIPTDKTVGDFFGPVPIAYVKLVAGKNTSILIGALPTLIGAEYTFSFENMNIERGLVWNQENAVNRGIQINQTFGKFTASLSWNDGFYSNRYSWLSGALAYVNGAHSLSFVAGGNLGQTAYQSLATPVQNNSTIYNVIYTYTKGHWIIQPYFQYSNVPTNQGIGIEKGAGTRGGAVLASYAFSHGFSLAGRWEYIASTGGTAQQSVNLLYGPGSNASSATVTPTFQQGAFFVRGDLSLVHAGGSTPGFAFGPNGTNQTQLRMAAEIGFMFGSNMFGKK